MIRSLFSTAMIYGAILILAILVALVPDPAAAQALSLQVGNDPTSTTSAIVQLLLLLTVLSVAPALLLMITAFTRLVVVMSILRTALGTNSSPPNMVIISLALFMTAFIMAPTFEAAWEAGMKPYMDGELAEEEAFTASIGPFRDFMLTHVRDQDLGLFLNIAGADVQMEPEEVPLQALIPAFMISELRRAFEIGFLIYLPFIIIDMVIASVLMSMGMMMLPPMLLALPFKIIFFVLVDGWYVLVGSLVQSFGPVVVAAPPT